MKRIIFLLFAIYCLPVNATYRVCGPDVDGREYSYTAATTIENRLMATWAVGNGCAGLTENIDVSTMCSDVIIGGQAYCAFAQWANKDLDEAAAAYGTYCYCRRTKMLSGGTLVDSVGQWVELGGSGSCYANCAKYCAESVSTDVNGMRNPIILLPAF